MQHGQVHMLAARWVCDSGCRHCRFYFAYCEAAFDAHYIHNFQITWTKQAEPEQAPTQQQDTDGKLRAVQPTSAKRPPDRVTQAKLQFGRLCLTFTCIYA